MALEQSTIRGSETADREGLTHGTSGPIEKIFFFTLESSAVGSIRTRLPVSSPVNHPESPSVPPHSRNSRVQHVSGGMSKVPLKAPIERPLLRSSFFRGEKVASDVAWCNYHRSVW
jgi:hypothetical protein